MKTKILLLAFLCLFISFSLNILAQNTFPATGNAGIGTTSPLASAALEMKSTSEGLLIPRMTQAQRNAVLVSTSAKGLLIYQTDGTPGFYYYDGTKWATIYSKAANTSLSNLKTTAIDSSLYPATNNLISLGSSSKRWKDVNLYNLKFSDGTIQTTAYVPGANTSLSNLTATSVNQSLIPSANNVVDIGSSTKSWRNAYLSGNLKVTSVIATSTNAAAISGTSTTNYGVYGSSGYLGVYGTGTHYGTYGFSQDSIGAVGASLGTGENSYGVYGYNPNKVGVYGQGGMFGVSGSGSFAGVSGSGDFGNGVEGYSSTGIGAYGSSLQYYGVFGICTGGSYAGFFDGDVYTSGSYQGSDRTLKQNIRDFTSAMNIINKLHPTQYKFRQDGNYKLMHLPAGNHYGLIAQDVEKVLPNLIKETKFDPALATPHNITKDSAKSDVINFKALNYTELIPIMIKGMQELSQQNDSLKNKIVAQQQINYDLETRLAKLEAMMNVSSVSINNQQSTVISSSSLQQNIPNPFTHTTNIGYSLPQKFTSAQIVITDKSGRIIKAINILSNKGNVIIDASTLASGAYQYSLIVDGRLIDTKQMVLAK